MRSIRGKIILLVLVSVFISALIIGGVSTFMIYSTNNDRIDQMETQLRTGYDTNIKHQVEIVVSELDGIMNQVNAGVINNTQTEKIAATMDTQADLMRGIQENSTDLKKISDLMKELVQRFRI